MATITDVTTGAVGGTGYFDKMMTAINAQIDVQFAANRIQSKDYATVYLGAIQLAMTEAVKYVGVVEQVTASQASSTNATALRTEQITASSAQTVNANAKTSNDDLLRAEQITSSTAKTSNEDLLRIEQITASTAQTVNANAKTSNENSLRAEQVTASTAQTVNANAKTDNENLLRAEQITASSSKTSSETALYSQKVKTEKAQILNSIDGVTVAGEIGQKKALQAAQSLGYVRDAEQKAAKIVLDAWSVSKSTMGAATDDPNTLTGPLLGGMVTKLRLNAGIN